MPSPWPCPRAHQDNPTPSPRRPKTLVDVDVLIANILPGPLRRLSGTLALAVRPGGRLCLSGMRPEQASAVREAFEPYIDFDVAPGGAYPSGRHEKWGAWVRMDGTRKTAAGGDAIKILSDSAVA